MSILDPIVHKRLIEELDEVARRAGVPKHYIENSMQDYCTAEEVEWVRSFKDHVKTGVFGLAYVGCDHTQRMMAMCGAFTRNFILAQLVTLTTLIEDIRSGDGPDPTVLIIPSFQRSMSKSPLTPYQAGLLWDLMESRMIAEKLTVIGVDSIPELKTAYGDHFAQLITNHFTVVF